MFPKPNEPCVLFTDVSKHSWSRVLTQECITIITGKDTKSFLPITYFSGTFVGSQKYWVNLTEEAYLHDIQETFILPL